MLREGSQPPVGYSGTFWASSGLCVYNPHNDFASCERRKESQFFLFFPVRSDLLGLTDFSTSLPGLCHFQSVLTNSRKQCLWHGEGDLMRGAKV